MFNCATCIIATYAQRFRNVQSMIPLTVINTQCSRIELCLYICAKDEMLHFVCIVQHIETGIYVDKLHSQILRSKRKYHT